MQTVDALRDAFRQHHKLPIRIVSPDFGHLSPEIAAQYGLTIAAPMTFFCLCCRAVPRMWKKGCTPAQLAIAWVLALGEDIITIPGSKRISHLEENIQSE